MRRDVHTQRSRQRGLLLALCLGSMLLLLLPSFGAQEQEGDNAIHTAQNLSRAFTQVAKRALPAVVFIKVEKTVIRA